MTVFDTMTSKPSWRAAEQLAVASFMTVELQARNARQSSSSAFRSRSGNRRHRRHQAIRPRDRRSSRAPPRVIAIPKRLLLRFFRKRYRLRGGNFRDSRYQPDLASSFLGATKPVVTGFPRFKKGGAQNRPSFLCRPVESPDGRPDQSTYAMLMLGFAGVAYMGYRRARASWPRLTLPELRRRGCRFRS